LSYELQPGVGLSHAVPLRVTAGEARETLTAMYSSDIGNEVLSMGRI